MSVETVADRMRLYERLLERTAAHQINAIPLPARPGPLTAAEIADAWGALQADLPRLRAAGHYLNLYLHVPYCRAKCAFCMYDSRLLRPHTDVEAYVRFVREQVEFFARVLGGAVFQNLHVGGGTPTILEDAELGAILGGVFDALSFAEDGSRVIETNPENVTPSKVALLLERGFNKFSVGVQSLDPSVLALHRRGYQTREHVSNAIRTLREAGAGSINCDFMLGLAGDSSEAFLAGFEELLSYGPDTVMLTKVQPQRPYIRQLFSDDPGRFEAQYSELLQVIEPMLVVAQKRGYATDNPYANELGWRFWRNGFRPPYSETRPYYCTGGEYPMSTLGIGRFAKSKIYGRMIYENKHPEPRFEPSAPHFEGVRIDERHEIVRHVITEISRRRKIDGAAFGARFGVAPEEVFATAIDGLTALGLVERNGKDITFPSSSSRELFIQSRLFLDRRAVLDELGGADWETLVIWAGERRWRLRIERLGSRGNHGYLEVVGALGLRWIEPESTRDVLDVVVSQVVQRLFRSMVSDRPWISALEVAPEVARRARSWLGARMGATVEVE